MPPPGPDFLRKAQDLAGDRPIRDAYLQILYSLALYQDWFYLDVMVKGSPRMVRFIPGHIWGGARAEGPRCQADVMIIGKLPGREEVRACRNLAGPSGEVLEDALQRVGCEPDQYMSWYITNILKFGHPAPHLGNTIATDWLKDCRPLTQMELRLVRPKFVLCLGSEAGKELLGPQGAVNNSAGKVFDLKIPLPDGTTHECKAMTCIHSAAVARSPDLLPQLMSALRLFTRLVNGEKIGETEKDIQHIVAKTEAEAIFWLDTMIEATKDGGAIAVDCEWQGEQPTEPGSWLRTIQVSHKPKFALCLVIRNKGGSPALIDCPNVRTRLQVLFNRPNIRAVGHFHRADLPWLIHYGLDIRKQFEAPEDPVNGWELTKTQGGFDTGQAAHSVCETDDLKLEVQATRLTGCPRYDMRLQEAKKELAKKLKVGLDSLPGYGDIEDEDIYPYACLHKDSLVQLADGTWHKIGELVAMRYAGRVKSFKDGRVVNALVTNWHRHAVGQTEWYQLVLPGDKAGRWGLCGPVFTPDHQVITQRGKVRIDELIIGEDRIATDEREFSTEQLSVVLGSLLGDGGFTRKNACGVGLGFGQRAATAAYADWKATSLSSHMPRLRHSRNGYRRYELPFSRYLAHLSVRFPTKEYTDHRCRKLCLTDDVLLHLGDLGLAVWYQDDGTLVTDKRTGRSTASRIYCVLDEDEVTRVLRWLRGKFGDGVTYNHRNRFIQIAGTSFAAFHRAINPYMHKCMAYKTPLVVSAEFTVQQDGPAFYAPIYKVRPWAKPRRRGYGVRYCLTVPETGNFLTKSGFVSNCYDVDVTRRLFDIYNGVGDEPGLLDCDDYGNNSRMAFWISMRASPACLEMEQTGMLVDMKRAEALVDTYRTAMARRVAELKEMIGWDTFNPNSSYDCRELLFGVRYRGQIDKETQQPKRGSPPTAKLCNLMPIKATGKATKKSWEELERSGEANFYTPAADKETLGILFHMTKNDDVGKIVGCLRDIRFLGQLLKTTLKPPKSEGGKDVLDDDGDRIFEDGLLSYICEDYRIRTHIFQTLETGRYASARPNLQNISKRREADYKRIMGSDYLYPLRSIFVAPKGHVLIEADYVGAELAGMAWMSGDPTMIEHVRRAQLPEDHPDYYDIHSAVAVAAFRLNCQPTKKGLESIGMLHLRVAAKNVVFGYAYGRGAEAICRQAKEEGVNITIEEAQALINGLTAQYPLLPIFFNQCRQRTEDPLYMINCFGRIRRFSPTNDYKVQGEQGRQAMNFPIQSLVADAMSRALDHLYFRRQLYGLHYKIVLQIHDAVILEVPCEEAEVVYDKVLPECMTNLVPIRPCNLDGIPIDNKVYNLGIDREVYVKWGEKLSPEDAKEWGVPERFIKAKKK